MPDDNGTTIRQHLEKVWEQTGLKPAWLEDEPELPPAVQHIWLWFTQLSATRSGGMGPAPISYQEIDAWSRLTGTAPTTWEVEQIGRLDRVWFQVRGEEEAKKREK